MQNSAKEVIRAAIFSAVIEAVSAFREQSNGVPNVMIRDLAAVHDNTAFSDLPDAVQTAIRTSTDEALRRLHKDGFAIQLREAPRGDKFSSAPRAPRGNKFPSPRR